MATPSPSPPSPPSYDFEPALLASISDIVYDTQNEKAYSIKCAKKSPGVELLAKIFSFKEGTGTSPLQYALWDISSSDQAYRSLCISFRGTHLPQDWLVDLDFTPRRTALDDVNAVATAGKQELSDRSTSAFKGYLKDAALKPADSKATQFNSLSLHQGFDRAVVEHEADIFAALSQYRSAHGLKNTRLLITGHSLGGSLAEILGLRILAHHPDIVKNGGAVVVFGAPMVVCGDGAAAYTTLNQVYADFHKSASDPDFSFHTWVNNNDIVPRLFGMQNKNLPAGRLKGFIDVTAAYHPIGSYEFIQGAKHQSEPSPGGSDAPMGSLTGETAITRLLGVGSTLMHAANDGWHTGLQSHGIDLYCKWLGSTSHDTSTAGDHDSAAPASEQQSNHPSIRKILVAVGCAVPTLKVLQKKLL